MPVPGGTTVNSSKAVCPQHATVPSDFSAQEPSYDSASEVTPDNGVVQIGIRWTRSDLAERIARRVDQMIADGLVDEVRSLMPESPTMSRTAAQALGYKEMIDHIAGRASLEEARNEVVLRTVQFAVRQERWYRRDPRITWVDVTNDTLASVSTAVSAALSE